MKEQQSVASMIHKEDTMQRTLAARLSFGLKIGLAVMLALTLLEALLFLLLHAFHIADLFSLLLHAPQVLLVPLIELLLFTLLVLLGLRTLAVALYLRQVHGEQRAQYEVYTPLTSIRNIRQTPELDLQRTPALSQEQRVALTDLVEQQETHQLILGVPGAGKTMLLRAYQYMASQPPLALAMQRARIPVFVPMKNYSLFLKSRVQAPSTELLPTEQPTLLDFLRASDLPALKRLRPYLAQLAQEGRLLLLCDGLNELDSNYLSQVSQELVQWMRATSNRLVMTCREVDYREQAEFVTLVEEGRATKVVIYPLQTTEINEFVERYVEHQDRQWRHTAGQIMQVIDRSRLRYHCTNPMMLFTLMGIIDKIGVERGKQIDTRGRLLRESVRQLIAREQEQSRWSGQAPAEREVVRFLSEVACAARWANDRNAIQLRVSSNSSATGDEPRPGADVAELVDELQYWLDEHPAKGPFETEDGTPGSDPYTDLAQLLQFSRSAGLIEISTGGVLSFRHELIAEYFVAEYFFVIDNRRRSLPLPLREELLENVGRWSEPVAIWAGLLDDPLALAERFAILGNRNPAYVLQALALSLVCVGVLWTPPQAEVQRTVVLPQHVAEALALAVRNRAAREELARIFMRCAEEGGQEVYRSLLPLVMVDGVDELLVLLDQAIVPDLLFTQLQDTIDNAAYEPQVRQLTKVLGRFGHVVTAQAAELSEPLAERSTRLRAAAINILGGTSDQQAVEPLIMRLRDSDPFIINRAVQALFRLGPDLTLTPLLRELENLQLGPFSSRVHQAALLVLGRFLEEAEGRRHVSLLQYQRVLDSIVPVLTSNYQQEPEIQRVAREVLAKQGRASLSAAEAQNEQIERGERAIRALLRFLPTQNEVAARNVILTLQEIGAPATPRLFELTNDSSELVRVRCIEILRVTRDVQALPRLLQMLGDSSPAVQQQAARALQAYAPESIPGLIELVLAGASEAVAERAAHVLRTIGDPTIGPISATFTRIVPGRTRLLVQVLAGVRDPQAVPALISLLQMPQREKEPLLSIALVRTLGQFQDSRIAPPLLQLLAEPNPQVYEEAINALSQLGELVLPPLLEALDTQQETPLVQRVKRAILSMAPFPGEQLIQALAQTSDAQALQIVSIFRAQGAEAAQALVKHMLHPDERVRGCIQLALNDMPGAVVVPALLEALNQPGQLRKTASGFLLRYPDAAISPLVHVLGEPERGDIAAGILPLFGPEVLAPLVSGLDDQRTAARERAREIIATLVQQSEEQDAVLREIIHLFTLPPPPRAHEILLEVLTDELADVSIPPLLEGLEDAHLVEDVSSAFERLARRGPQQNSVLSGLVQALSSEERRRGAEVALTRIGAPAVPAVGPHITDKDQQVARAAQRVLRDIGVEALPFIWAAHSDTSNPTRREAAQDIFHSMDTEIIKDKLVQLLVSDEPDDIAMAITLLLERIHDEASKNYADRTMIPVLFDFIQTNNEEELNLRIIAMLLLLGEDTIFDHLIQAIEDYPQRRQQLTNVLLLMGARTEEALLDVFNDPATPVALRPEIAAVLGMMSAPEVVTEYAARLSEFGISGTRASVLFPEQLAISLHALGGLLAGGHWHARTLQHLRDGSKEGSPEHELYSVLLGWRFEPRLLKLQNELGTLRQKYEQEVTSFALRAATDQKRVDDLEEQLEEIRHEHGARGSELHRLERERDGLRNDLDQTAQERDNYYYQLQQALRENQTLRDHNAQLSWQLKNSTTP